MQGIQAALGGHIDKAQIGAGSLPPDPLLRIRFITKNRFIFKSVFKAQKTRKVAPKASKKHKHRFPKSERDFHDKSIFAIPSMRKPRFGSLKRRNFNSEIDKQMTWKQARTKNEISSFLNSKANIHRSQNHPKIE